MAHGPGGTAAASSSASGPRTIVAPRGPPCGPGPFYGRGSEYRVRVAGRTTGQLLADGVEVPVAAEVDLVARDRGRRVEAVVQRIDRDRLVAFIETGHASFPPALSYWAAGPSGRNSRLETECNKKFIFRAGQEVGTANPKV